jgi:hypothetical protein
LKIPHRCTEKLEGGWDEQAEEEDEEEVTAPPAKKRKPAPAKKEATKGKEKEPAAKVN